MTGGVSYEKFRDEIEKHFENRDITAADLQDDIRGPIFIKDYREQVTKRLKDDNFIRILAKLCCFYISSNRKSSHNRS